MNRHEEFLLDLKQYEQNCYEYLVSAINKYMPKFARKKTIEQLDCLIDYLMQERKFNNIKYSNRAYLQMINEKYSKELNNVLHKMLEEIEPKVKV